MKYKAYKLIMVVMVFVIFNIGCKTKDKLTGSTLILSINPDSATLAEGATKTFSVSGFNNSKDVTSMLDIVWELSSALGTLNTNSGETVTFTAGSTSGSVTLRASDGSVSDMATINITATGAPPTEDLVIYDDGGFSSDLTGPHWFDGGDGSPNGAPWTINFTSVGSGIVSDSSECQQCDYTDSGASWGGMYLEFSSGSEDLTAYSNLTFYVKGAIGGENVEIKIKDTIPTEVAVELDDHLLGGVTTSWQKVSIPISAFASVDKSKILMPFLLAFSSSVTGSNATIYIDYIRWE